MAALHDVIVKFLSKRSPKILLEFSFFGGSKMLNVGHVPDVRVLFRILILIQQRKYSFQIKVLVIVYTISNNFIIHTIVWCVSVIEHGTRASKLNWHQKPFSHLTFLPQIIFFSFRYLLATVSFAVWEATQFGVLDSFGLIPSEESCFNSICVWVELCCYFLLEL